jgi:hypothetical protein
VDRNASQGSPFVFHDEWSSFALPPHSNIGKPSRFDRGLACLDLRTKSSQILRHSEVSTRFPFCFPGWMIVLQVGTALPRGLPSRSSTCTTPYFGCVADTVEVAASIPQACTVAFFAYKKGREPHMQSSRSCITANGEDRWWISVLLRLQAMCSQPLAPALLQPFTSIHIVPLFA